MAALVYAVLWYLKLLEAFGTGMLHLHTLFAQVTQLQPRVMCVLS